MTPEQHRDQAVMNLAACAESPEAPNAQRVLTQAAIAHALLGLLEIQIRKTLVDKLVDLIDLNTIDGPG